MSKKRVVQEHKFQNLFWTKRVAAQSWAAAPAYLTNWAGS